MSFGKNLERIRKDYKISQASLGEALNLTQQMISSYEKDLSSPNLDVLIKIADYFHVSLDSLAGHVVNLPEAYTKEARLLRYFDSLAESDKEKCITIVETLLTDRDLNRRKR